MPASSDWHRLIEICSVTRTLIADEAGVYDPREPNDRLLLGVKGTLSEAELFTLRTRLYEGRWNKARKGQLARSVPTGFVVGPDGSWIKDPDLHVQDRLNYVFLLFRQCGVARRVMCTLREEKLKLPTRIWGGPRHGQIEWKQPTSGAPMRILHNPAYAGTYVYGQFSYEGNRRSSKTGKLLAKPRPVEEWPVCVEGHHEGYVSWDEYLQNQRRLSQNWFRSMTRGAPREGSALLQGIVYCGVCGAKMGVNSYSAREKRRPSYMCCREYSKEGGRHTCQNMSAGPIDDAVVALYLEAIEPAQIEIALKAADQLQEERQALKRQWERQLAQARYEAQLAQRQYDAVDPDNRLVAGTIEKRWNEKLESLKKLEEAFAEAQQGNHFSITPQEAQRIRALVRDLPAVWNAPTTTDQERKQLLRYLISEVQLDGVSEPGKIEIRVTWRSGAVTVRKVDRLAVRAWAPRTADTVIERIRALAEQYSAAQIAEQLNREGLRSAHGKMFREHHVLYIAHRHGVSISTVSGAARRECAIYRPGGQRSLN